MSEGRDLSLTREQIIGLLAELGEELDARGVKAHQDDIRFLARETGAKTVDDVLRIAEQVIGSNRLLPKAQFIVQEMFPEDPAEPSPP